MLPLPLSERISPPQNLLPLPVDGFTWRPLTLDDVDAVVEINRQIAAADHPDWEDSREETLDELSHSYLDLGADSLAAFDRAGDLVAWGAAVVPPTQETLVRSILLGGVAPSFRGRGIGRALLAWQHDRALQQLATSSKTLPGWIVVSADERAPASGRLIERAGFVAQRWFQTLARPAGDALPAIATIDGIRIVRYETEYSEAAHATRDEAFRGVGSSQPMSDEQWESMMSLSSFAPELSYVALDAHGAVVGLLLALRVDDGATAHVWVVGVAPRARGRGVGRNLIAEHLRSLPSGGVGQSVLDVATDGLGEGLNLYTGMGYSPRSVSVNYVRVY